MAGTLYIVFLSDWRNPNGGSFAEPPDGATHWPQGVVLAMFASVGQTLVDLGVARPATLPEIADAQRDNE